MRGNSKEGAGKGHCFANALLALARVQLCQRGVCCVLQWGGSNGHLLEGSKCLFPSLQAASALEGRMRP